MLQDLVQGYDAIRKENSSGSSKDKKRTLTHSELLDKYYDEGKKLFLFALSPSNREKPDTV